MDSNDRWFGPPNPEIGRAARIMAELGAAIDRGEYAEGSRLPSERELVQKYEASRDTIRRALNDLEASGYIYRQGTAGTFVSPKANRMSLPTSTNLIKMPTVLFYPAGREEGEPPRPGFLSEKVPGVNKRSIYLAPISLVPANEYIARRLRVSPHTLVLRRLRVVVSKFVDPYEIWDSYHPGKLFADLLESPLVSPNDELPLERWLREQHGRRPGRAIIEASVRFPSAPEAFWLQLARSAPVVDVERVVLDNEGEPVEISRIVTRAIIYDMGREYDLESWE